MSTTKQLSITNIPEISAIYFALLQAGYDYYTLGRDFAEIQPITCFMGKKDVPPFFTLVKQNTCEAYNYWPRAALLEKATFYLTPDYSAFSAFTDFHNSVMSANNIADFERDQSFWNWIIDFPPALRTILSSNGFARYLQWEDEWLKECNIKYKTELCIVQECLEVCAEKYQSPIQNIEIVINPIKCVYATDFYLKENTFIFCSGSFRVGSIIHEFLHHIVHPVVVEHSNRIIDDGTRYPDVDISYYLSGGNDGQANSFEEYAVRELTEKVLASDYPNDLTTFVMELLKDK